MDAFYSLIDSHTTIDNTVEVESLGKTLELMVYDAIPNYLKMGMLTIINDNADTTTHADPN